MRKRERERERKTETEREREREREGERERERERKRERERACTHKPARFNYHKLSQRVHFQRVVHLVHLANEQTAVVHEPWKRLDLNL